MSKREVTIACATGAAIAAVLMLTGWHSGSEARDTISFWAQSPGTFTAGRVMRVVHLPVFDCVALVVNTFVYGIIVLAGLKVRHSFAR